MKKWLAVFLALVMLLSMTACGKEESETPAVSVQRVEEQNTVPVQSEGATVEEAVAEDGYWEMIRIDSNDPNYSMTEEEMELVREQGIAIYLDLLEDGTGSFCFEDRTDLTWQPGSVTIEDGTFDFKVEEDLLVLDMVEVTCVFRRAVRPYPVVSEMAQAGFTQFIEEWVTYPYTTICSEDETALTTGEATVIAYEVFQSDEDYPEKEGYEWRVVTMEVRFFDENARQFGAWPFYRCEDYYGVKLHDDTYEELDESEEYASSTQVRMYYGQEVETYCRIRDSWSSWRKDAGGNSECFYNVEFAYQVPVGYDGAVAVLENGSYVYPEDSYITDCDPAYFLMFRLN